jgi:hypothetical protein
VPVENPQWLVIPERGLFTGVAILGAIGSGKTSCCMYPFAEQILAYRSKKHEPLSTRRGQMFNLSQKPQVIPLRSASEAKG